MTVLENIYYKMFRTSSKLNLLIGINVAVYLFINVPSVFEYLLTHRSLISYYSEEYLLMPAYLPKLATRFWTPLTYMFMHANVFHILFNMLWLYWLGQIFEEFLGEKRTVGLYLFGGLAGAAFYIACYNLLPAFNQTGALQNSIIVGASASVMAVVIGAATIVPNYTISLMFVGPVRLKWLAAFFIIIDFLSITGPNVGGEIAHMGGALFGFIYVKQLQSGRDMIGFFNKVFKAGPNLKVVSNNKDRDSSGMPRQEDVDRILDKISRSGYESLSKQEKEILFRASKK